MMEPCGGASLLRSIPTAANQRAASHTCGSTMEENRSRSAEDSRDCICTILKLFTDFGQELKLGDAVLRVDVSALASPPPPKEDVFISLQRHISDLQSVSEVLQSLVLTERHSKVLASRRAADTEGPRARRPPLCHGGSTTDNEEEEDGEVHGDDLTVQIRAGKSEIDRRIFAFMERKQMEINENNVREFCNVIDCNQENSCARTDAVFTPYPGFKSHVKVTRVVNTYGPQTRGDPQPRGDPQKKGPLLPECGNPAVQERLHNMESHLKLAAAGPVPLSVYQRLQKLENRILELEGLSPEYFQSAALLHKRVKTSTAQGCSLTELDGKISAMKAALLRRVSQLEGGDGGDGGDGPPL